MSDRDLRALERAWTSSGGDEAFFALDAARARLGKPRLCGECREALATTTDDNDEPSCLPCRESALEHGHQHGMHDDFDDEDSGPSECPLCRRVTS